MLLEFLRISYGIPNSISHENGRENEKPSHPPAVTMHPDFFTYGIRLSLHSHFRYVLNNFKCAFTQLSPLVWHATVDMYVIWKQKKFLSPHSNNFNCFTNS